MILNLYFQKHCYFRLHNVQVPKPLLPACLAKTVYAGSFYLQNHTPGNKVLIFGSAKYAFRFGPHISGKQLLYLLYYASAKHPESDLLFRIS